ncbi:hypothetical protein NEUTE2DRAFT_124317 [Neurospora tetrasperma FGSC 2509]|nr:hypothetical protein NEUTE2DRAFT_124317 [Neurospora tetrasperma FGSC 2509]
MSIIELPSKSMQVTPSRKCTKPYRLATYMGWPRDRSEPDPRMDSKGYKGSSSHHLFIIVATWTEV